MLFRKKLVQAEGYEYWTNSKEGINGELDNDSPPLLCRGTWSIQ